MKRLSLSFITAFAALLIACAGLALSQHAVQKGLATTTATSSYYTSATADKTQSADTSAVIIDKDSGMSCEDCTIVDILVLSIYKLVEIISHPTVLFLK